MSVSAVIVAAGKGVRAGGPVPKQYQGIAGLPVLARTIRAIASHPAIAEIIVVLNPDDAELFKTKITPHIQKTNVRTVDGGTSRSQSVRNGLLAIGQDTVSKVLIHDGARPFVTAELIDRLLAALKSAKGAAPALPVSDALWRGKDDVVKEAVSREGLFRAQTPQAFELGAILAAYASATEDAADDVETAKQAGIDVTIVAGDENNIKITRPEDFIRAEKLLRGSMDIRTGNGYDVHAFTKGDHVTLCGVAIPHDQALLGHSDADVAMHAVTDAIYGALAEGDIGQWFPPSDKKWKNAPSHIFLKHAVELAAVRGFSINHVDCTLVCELPKIGPYAKDMRTNMCNLMGLTIDRISVKATTSEKLGFAGRGEGIVAQATVTMVSK